LIRYRFALLPLFSTFVADPTQKNPIWQGGAINVPPPRLYQRRFMKEVPPYQVVSRPSSTQIPVGLVNCCIVRSSPQATGADTRYISQFVHR
jgi:hypothetical protein